MATKTDVVAKATDVTASRPAAGSQAMKQTGPRAAEAQRAANASSKATSSRTAAGVQATQQTGPRPAESSHAANVPRVVDAPHADEAPTKKAKKFDTQGSGSRARRSQARANQEVANIKRAQEGLPVAACPLQQQIRWEAKLQGANAALEAITPQVMVESASWKETTFPAGSVALPSYIPAGAKFVSPISLHASSGVPLTPAVPNGVPQCPAPPNRVPVCPAPQTQATSKLPSSSSLIRGPFQGVYMHGPSVHIGAVVALPVATPPPADSSGDGGI